MHQHTTHRTIRARIFQKLEKYPSSDVYYRFLDQLIMLCAIGGPIATFPQVFAIYSTKTAGVSILSWTLYIVFNIPLVAYGLAHKENIVTFHSALNIFMEIAVIAGAVMYG